MWLLIPEHLRLGSWDLIKAWTRESDEDVNPRLALQLVNEAALCTNGIRQKRSLCHQGFDILNGLPFIATDDSIHRLLSNCTIEESQNIQMTLGKIREAKGHYTSDILALDPHRISTYSRRIMPKKKKNPRERAEKVLQTFFLIDSLTGQPIAFTIGSSTKTASKATKELLTMMDYILLKKSLVMADTEHSTVEILSSFQNNDKFDLLIPMPIRNNIKRRFNQIEYHSKWPGYALGEESYKMSNAKTPVRLIVQRSGEKENQYGYKPFAYTGKDDVLKMITEDYPERWSIEEFFNFESAMGWSRASTMNLNIRYGKMSLALIAQAATYELRKKMPPPYRTWTAKHLANTLFREIDGDIRVKGDTIIITYYKFPNELNLKKHYENMPEKLLSEGIDPRIPWLFNFKLDFRFK